MDKFLELFDGMDLDNEFKEKLVAIFNEAVENKVEESKTKEADMCEVCDENPATTMNKYKQHVCKTCKDQKAKKMTLVEEDDEPLNRETVGAKDLIKDPDIRKILNALKINPAKFARSLEAAAVDINGNVIGDDSFKALLEILEAIAEDPQIANRLAMTLKKKNSEEESSASDENESMNEEQLIQNIDKYLTFIAEQYFDDNKLAIENGIKIQLVESFLSGLKNLYEEHNIDVPEDESIVTKLNGQITELKTKLNESMEKQIALSEKYADPKEVSELKEKNELLERKLLEAKAKLILVEKTSGIPVTTVDKIKKLSESIEFDTLDEFSENLDIIIEQFSNRPSKPARTSEVDEPEVIEEDVEDPVVDYYASKIKKNIRF